MVPNVLLDAWATMMWRACWQGGLVVLAVWLICRLLPSMPAQLQCWFWRLAILKFMIVLLLPSLIDLPLLPAPLVAPTKVVPHPIFTEIPISPIHQVQITPSKVIELPSFREILCLAWIIGVGWSGFRLLLAWRESKRLRKSGRTIEHEAIIEQLAIQAGLFGLRTPPRILEAAGGGGPMLIGIFRPAIVIPAETLRRMNVSEQALAFGHEIAHIRRGDLFWGLVASLVHAVFFFHPLVWLSDHQLKLAQEIAADNLVITKQRHDPVSYGELLVSLVGKLGVRPLASSISLETAGPVRSLTWRLLAMTHFGRTSRRVIVFSGLLLAAVVLLGLIPWRLVAAEPKKPDRAALLGEKDSFRILPPAPYAATQHFHHDSLEYCALLTVIERKKNQPEHVVCREVEAAYRADPDWHCEVLLGARPIRITLSASEEGKLVKHSVTAMIFREGLSLDEIERLEKLGKNNVGEGSNAAIISSKQMTLTAHESTGKLTGKITATEADGSVIDIDVTISPIKPPSQDNGEGQPVAPLGTKSQVQPDPWDEVPVESETFTIAVLNRGTRVAAVNKLTGEKRVLDIPRDMRVANIFVNGELSACILQGTPVSQLILYNSRLGKWSIYQLPESDRLVDARPIVGDHVACYPLKGLIVAYSGTKDSWDVLATTATPVVGDYAVEVETATDNFEFTAESGKWVAVKTPTITKQ